MLSGKEPACQFRRLRFHPWVGKIPWRRKWQNPFRCFCLGNPMGRGATVHGVAESGNTTECAGVRACSPLFTDLGFFCFEMLCSLIQYDGLFKKSFWRLPSQRQVVRAKATRVYGRIVAYEQDRSFLEASMVGGKLTNFSLFVLKFPDFSTENPASQEYPPHTPTRTNQNNWRPCLCGEQQGLYLPRKGEGK